MKELRDYESYPLFWNILTIRCLVGALTVLITTKSLNSNLGSCSMGCCPLGLHRAIGRNWILPFKVSRTLLIDVELNQLYAQDVDIFHPLAPYFVISLPVVNGCDKENG